MRVTLTQDRLVAMRRSHASAFSFRLILAERFNAGDDATDHSADHSADGVPTARVQSTESTTGHTQQDVAHGMPRRFCQSLRPPAWRRRSGVVAYNSDNCKRNG